MVLTLANRLGHFAGAFDLIIVDEAQHSVASTWTRILAAFPDAHLLGVTATPERLDGRPLKDLYGELVMGPGVAELVTLGFLSPAVNLCGAGNARPLRDPHLARRLRADRPGDPHDGRQAHR